MNSIYSVFYEKLPQEIENLLPDNSGKLVTFLNPFYLEKLKGDSDLYTAFDYICSDGMLPIALNKFWGKKKSVRISFDMTSLAKVVFEQCVISKLGIYFLGTTCENMNKFIHLISVNYPNLLIAGYHHGYIKECLGAVAEKIISSGAEVVIIGMGAPLQDEFAVALKGKGFNGTIYTCGGFFHQTTERMNYYPAWINRWNLRTPYRLFHERYVWIRLIKYYPRFLINYSSFLIRLSSV